MCSAAVLCFCMLLLPDAACHWTACSIGTPEQRRQGFPASKHCTALCPAPLILSCSMPPFSRYSGSMPAQPATALQCSADPLSAQAGTPGDQERAFSAVAAANRQGGGSESVLDALEAAESQSQAAPAQGAKDASTASAEGQQGGISSGASLQYGRMAVSCWLAAAYCSPLPPCSPCIGQQQEVTSGAETVVIAHVWASGMVRGEDTQEGG